jgi:hypothetical protein
LIKLDDFELIELDKEDEAGIQETEHHETRKKTEDDYRNRILQKACSWFVGNEKASIRRYAEDGGVREITEEDRNNRQLHLHTSTLDLNYEQLNPSFIKLFLDVYKKKANGKYRSHVNIRKFDDAIKWGARQRNVALANVYHVQMAKYLLSYKKSAMAIY